MLKTASPIQERSRLIRSLAALSPCRIKPSQKNLAEQLGRLIDLSDSITLARALERRPGQGPRYVDSAEIVRDDLLETRERMVRTIARSFAPESGPSRIKLPTLQARKTAEELMTFEPYHRFYAMHQADLDASIQALRLRVREGIAGFSADLSQLASLDKTLGDSLAPHHRKLFTVVPKLLEHRFTELTQQQKEQKDDCSGDSTADPAEWGNKGGWLEPFYLELRELLLAELDVRLQPVLGLLEALNEREDLKL